jgi:hypothetical protein
MLTGEIVEETRGGQHVGVEATTVWAARLGSPDEGIKGTLELMADRVAFVSENAETQIHIGLSDVRHVRRIHGSPVMIIEHAGAVVAFYFAQPPPVLGSRRPFRGRGERSSSVSYLGDTNAAKRKDIKQWVREIRDAARGARR